ncbi:hypothetical protein FRB96_003529 [Tulasnella sp. 330]|nr:hypothetical protein FRB96_003529 [Tulasnella sp. 330]KAG8885534.1 hypothetical protein FRB97_000859 [Tulasnella sp. 331]KAG8890340.1 hypothetical protein FRB98_009408 [Tulasnella sp. 332]
MPSWSSRGDSHNNEREQGGYQDQSYSNVPSSPSVTDPLQPPVRSPMSQSSPRNNYIRSPLNPNAVGTGSRSRPVSWGLDKTVADSITGRPQGTAGSDGSSGSSGDGRDIALRAVQSGAIGSGLGPYAPIRPPYTQNPEPPRHHHRFSTLSSAGSLISLSDSKYPMMYGGGPQSNAHLTGSFLPYSDNPTIDYVTGAQLGDDDDALHDPNPAIKDKTFGIPWRGVLNVLLVFAIISGLIMLFAGYPVLTYVVNGGTWYGTAPGINGTGQFADLPNLPALIDPQTPESAKTRTGVDGEDYELVFSDEFNTDGRTFYEGDDPFWEAVDLNYWATADYEWYDPSAITTENGALVITLDSIPNHDLFYRSGMLQSWNKFCFTGGYVEVSVVFPGDQNAQGFWPAAWTMGNLGRPGYGGSTDGLWPYTYDSCDPGTLPNQTDSTGQPALAQSSGKGSGTLSYLPGQRLSACTCSGEDHPGPTNSKGRGAPEIDVFEAEKNKLGGPGGQTSQSSQFAPFAASYLPINDTTFRTLYTPDRTSYNTFLGSTTQQSLSTLTNMDPSNFQNGGMNFSVYGVEFGPNTSNRPAAYINWVAAGEPSAGMTAGATGPDPSVEIGQRLVSEEPMALVFNLGLSKSFQSVNLPTLSFPAKLYFDYVRVYQKKNSINVGCDPKDYPTADYINKHMNAYTNANYTLWSQAGYTYPKSSLLNGC